MSVDRPTDGARRGLAGRVLGGRYRVVRMVSAGANTLIADADDLELGRPVTVKLVRPEIAESEEFRRRFARTMRAMAKLSHPNIAAVHDWGEEEVGKRTTIYAVVEHLSGGSLRDLFDRGRHLDPSQALVVGLEVCRGLDFAHRKNLVHGELTPAKLVFGDDRRLRIVDFGLARLLTADDWNEPSTVPTHVARYSSPEQALGQPIDGRSRRLRAGPDPRRSGHRDGAVRRPLHGRHAVGTRRAADARVGGSRPAGVGARARRTARSDGPLVGVRVRPEPRAGGGEAAPAGADPDRRHEAVRGRQPAAPTERSDRRVAPSSGRAGTRARPAR